MNAKKADKQKEIDEELQTMKENNEEEEEMNNKQKEMWAEFNDQIEENFKWDDFYKSEIENYEEIYNKEMEKIEELKTKLTEFNVDVHEIDANFPDVDVVYKRLNYKLSK